MYLLAVAGCVSVAIGLLAGNWEPLAIGGALILVSFALREGGRQ